MEEFKKLPDESKSVIDRITYMDDDLNFIYENSLGFSTLLLKSGKLKNNCFKLIEYKETLSASSFSYLSENYLKQLEAYTFFANQLLLYFEKNSPEKDPNTKSLFNCQSLNFNTHITEVEKITGLKSQNFNQQNFIQEVKETPVFRKFSFNIPPKEKSFSDFISHEKNKEIEKIILEKFQNEKGKKLRYLIEYLNELGIISLVHGDRTKIYSAMKNSFNWEIGTHQSIFGNWFSKPNTEYTKFKETLNSYFPFLL
ncbi:MAG TPA: hypothetical protein PKN96_03090 [Flavobacterium sp.]|nr:hypothetical protein [Flavobacterium sp.]